MTSIQEKHNEIFEFLMKKRVQSPDLRFSLRTVNKDEKLKKGYWFPGDDRFLGISFWNAWANIFKKQELNIQFTVFEDGYCRIELRGDGTPEKAEIINNIANSLSFRKDQPSFGDIPIYWVKKFENKDYIKNLDQFILEDKPLIDSFLRRFDKENILFPFITEESFNYSLTKIRNWQDAKPKTLTKTVNSATKILELRIENIKRFSKSYINLDKAVVCFWGKNGTGKTTLLRTIAIAMAGSNDLDTSNEAIITLPKMINGNTKEYVKSAFIEITYTIEDFTKIEPSYNPITLIPKPIIKGIEIEKQSKLAYSEEDNPRTFNLAGIEKNTFKTLMIGFAQQNSKNELKNGENIWKPNFNDLNALVYDEADNRFNEFITWVGEKIAPEIVPSFAQRQENRKQINQIFRVISKITDDEMQLSENSLSAAVVTKFHPNGLPLKLMSQGYQNIIGWVGFFMKRLWEFGQMELPDEDFMKMPAVCLIDEIDTYLHPEWQYRILSVLVENFENVQFIVTSHSPFVLSSIPNDKVLIYEIKDVNGDIIIEQERENLFGAEINDVSKEMGTTKRFKIIDEEVEALFTSIYDNELEQADAKLAALQTKINPDSGDLIKAAMLIKTKKLLRQRNK